MTRRKNQSDFKSNKIINKATSELTKTAIIVTVVFIISVGFDLWYYVLGYNGVVDYILNSLFQVRSSFSGKSHNCNDKTRIHTECGGPQEDTTSPEYTLEILIIYTEKSENIQPYQYLTAKSTSILRQNCKTTKHKRENAKTKHLVAYDKQTMEERGNDFGSEQFMLCFPSLWFSRFLQKIGVWFASVNTTCNPFIYAVFMPVYRKAVVNTFFPCIGNRKQRTEATSENTVSTIT